MGNEAHQIEKQQVSEWNLIITTFQRGNASHAALRYSRIAYNAERLPRRSAHCYTQVVEARHSGMDCRNPVTGR